MVPPLIAAAAFHLALGGEVVSQFEKRGIVTYGAPQVFPIFAVDLGSPDLQVVGSSLNGRIRWDEEGVFTTRLRLKYNAATDRPFFETGEKLEDRVRRRRSSELEVFGEVAPVWWLDGTLILSQELEVGDGRFAQADLRLKPFGRFFPRGMGHLLEPGLVLSGGTGNGIHNTYLYGEGAAAGATFYGYGMTLTAPGVLDPFYPYLRVYRNHVTARAAKGAHVRPDERAHWTAVALFAVLVF